MSEINDALHNFFNKINHIDSWGLIYLATREEYKVRNFYKSNFITDIQLAYKTCLSDIILAFLCFMIYKQFTRYLLGLKNRASELLPSLPLTKHWNIPKSWYYLHNFNSWYSHCTGPILDKWWLLLFAAFLFLLLLDLSFHRLGFTAGTTLKIKSFQSFHVSLSQSSMHLFRKNKWSVRSMEV